jgi:hypothetical protein
VYLGRQLVSLKLLLATVFLAVTSPLVGHLLARAALESGHEPGVIEGSAEFVGLPGRSWTTTRWSHDRLLRRGPDAAAGHQRAGADLRARPVLRGRAAVGLQRRAGGDVRGDGRGGRRVHGGGRRHECVDGVPDGPDVVDRADGADAPFGAAAPAGVTAGTLVLGGLLVYGVAALPPFGDPAAPGMVHVSPVYIGQSVADMATPNVVTAVLADYRSFDTMIEAAVVVAAVLACLLVLKHRDDPIV